MIELWVLILALYFTAILGVMVVLLMRIMTTLELIVRSIPIGPVRLQERRPPNGSGSTSASGMHHRPGQEG